jgi:hypothetical protein
VRAAFLLYDHIIREENHDNDEEIVVVWPLFLPPPRK